MHVPFFFNIKSLFTTEHTKGVDDVTKIGSDLLVLENLLLIPEILF